MDVIIDTGLGLWDLHKFLMKQRRLIIGSRPIIMKEDNNSERRLSNNKPYMVIATHVHFDHSGGLYQFQCHLPVHRCKLFHPLAV